MKSHYFVLRSILRYFELTLLPSKKMYVLPTRD